jgi:ribonuclease P protein component
MRFRPEQHIRRPGDFRTAREKGRRIDCGAFAAWAIVTPAEKDAPARPRVGVVASTAAVGNAVARNRAKRRLRALFRENQHLLAPGTDLVLVARRAVTHADFRVLEQKFVDACHKLSSPPHA